MIKEAMTSFEVAKLLKQKGFDEPCLRYFDTNTDDPDMEYVLRIWTLDRRVPNSKLLDTEYTCCTHQMAMRWLREVYNIHVVPKRDFFGGFYTGRVYDGRRTPLSRCDDYIALSACKTYEDATESALYYVLTKMI